MVGRRQPMTMAETHDALDRLARLPTALGADIPEELMEFLRTIILERDNGSARLARFLREKAPNVRH